MRYVSVIDMNNPQNVLSEKNNLYSMAPLLLGEKRCMFKHINVSEKFGMIHNKWFMVISSGKGSGAGMRDDINKRPLLSHFYSLCLYYYLNFKNMKHAYLCVYIYKSGPGCCPLP